MTRGSWLGTWTQASVGAGGGGGGGLPNPDYGADLRVWLQQPVGPGTPAYANGGVLYLPTTRTYYAGDCGDIRGTNFIHPYDATLNRNGYLTLAPWSGAQVSVDLSNTAGGSLLSDSTKGGALNMGTPHVSDSSGYTGVGALRTCLDSFFFDKGSIRLCGTSHLRTFNCEHRFRDTDWKSQFDAVCADRGVTVVSSIPNTVDSDGNPTGIYWDMHGHSYMKNNVEPCAFRLNGVFNDTLYSPSIGGYEKSCHDLWMIGGKIHNVTDDSIFLGSAYNMTIQGMNMWAIDNSRDGYHGPGPQAWFHSDVIQWTGGEHHINILDCLLGGTVQLIAEAIRKRTELDGVTTADIDYLVIDRCWQYDSGQFGVFLGANPTNGYKIGQHSSSLGATSYKWFSNGHGDTSFNGQAAIEYGDNAHNLLSRTYGPRFTDPSITLNSNGYVVDHSQVYQNSLNPAVLWKAAHGDRDTYFAGTWD